MRCRGRCSFSAIAAQAATTAGESGTLTDNVGGTTATKSIARYPFRTTLPSCS
jgi:hypothetical protein